MNRQEILKLINDPRAVYYTPAVTLDVPAGGSATTDLQGYNSGLYGLNRILIGGSNLSSINVSAELNGEPGNPTILEPVQANALQNLFAYRSLKGAIPIKNRTNLHLTLSNTSASTIKVNVQIVGYTAEHYHALKDSYQARGITFPQPYFVQGQITLAAGATNSKLAITLPAAKLRLTRMALGSDSDSNIMLKIRQDKHYIKPQVFLSQINDEFRDMDIILPYDLEPRKPFEIYFDNLDGANPHTVSFIAETYKVD